MAVAESDTGLDFDDERREGVARTGSRGRRQWLIGPDGEELRSWT